MARKPLTDEEVLAQIEAARNRPPDEDQAGPRAVAARYDAPSGRIVVELDNDCLFAVPADLIQGLRGAKPEHLAEVEVAPGGDLHWEALDADHHTSFLLRGLFGNDAWMQELGRAGGKATSPAKARAARENGKKGGRPPKKDRPAA